MSTCANVTYFGMVKQTGLNPKVDGVIGLSQNSPFIGDMDGYSPRVGPLFMDALKQNQVIQTDIFSFCMRGYKGDQSSIDFGEPQIHKMKENSIEGIVTFRMNNDFFWSTYIQGVGFGLDPTYPTERSFSFHPKFTYTIFDNAASYIFIPPSAYPQLITEIQTAYGNPDFLEENGYQLINGNQAKPVPISFMFDNRWITLLPEDILIDVS